MKQYSLILSLLAALFAPCHIWSQYAITDSAAIRLAKAIEDFKNSCHSPGVAVAIVHGDSIVYSLATGYTDAENKTPVTIDSQFPIMSVSKTFAATMLVQLVEKGVVRLDDPVKKYVPEYKVQSDFKGYGPTTLLQLATHTSGLPRNTPADVYFASSFDRWMLGATDSMRWFSTKKELLQSLQYIKLDYPPFHFQHPNDRHYSNLGYSVLGIALERAVKTDYAAYVVSRICKPLGMQHSGFVDERTVRDSVAKGYAYNNATKTLDRLPLFEPGSALYPGGMYSTAHDLCRYISSQFDDNSSSSPKVISAGGRAMMRSLKLGWKPAYPFVLHEGAIPGYRSIVVFNPDSQLGWVILTNVQDVDFGAINNQLADITGKLFRKPKNRELAPYAGTYRLPHGYGSLVITVKNDSLYSSYLQDLLPGQPLLPDGDYRFKAQGKSGYAVQYEFVPGDAGGIRELRMGQFAWYKE